MLNALRVFAVLAGLAVVGWLVWETGPGLLVAQISGLGWRLGLVLLPQIVVSVLDAGGWRYAFPGRLPALGPLFAIRLAGEAVNGTTPTGTVGGDALKAWLVERADSGVRFAESLVSVIVAKTTLLGAQVAFLGLGLVVAWWAIGAPRPVTFLLALLTGVGGLAIAGFVWAQQHGVFRAGGRAAAALGLPARAATVAGELDSGLRGYYEGHRGRALVSTALHLAGWMVGTLEVWVALALLGSPVSLATALVIEAGITGVRSATFLVPASIGVQEGGVVGLFVALGLGAGVGLTFGIVRRIREVVWIVAGYACLAVFRGARPPGAAR